MEAQKHRFVVDSGGKKTSVLLPIEEYEKLMEESEELEAIQAYDAAKASDDEAIPFEQAVLFSCPVYSQALPQSSPG